METLNLVELVRKGKPTDVDSLTDLVSAVLTHFESHGPTSIDFGALHHNFVEPERLATVLRSTFSFRTAIPTWQHGLVVAVTACYNCGEPPTDMLWGLADFSD